VALEQLALPLAVIPVENKPDPHCDGVDANAVAVEAFPVSAPKKLVAVTVDVLNAPALVTDNTGVDGEVPVVVTYKLNRPVPPEDAATRSPSLAPAMP
jgi:hypothetical protein